MRNKELYTIFAIVLYSQTLWQMPATNEEARKRFVKATSGVTEEPPVHKNNYALPRLHERIERQNAKVTAFDVCDLRKAFSDLKTEKYCTYIGNRTEMQQSSTPAPNYYKVHTYRHSTSATIDKAGYWPKRYLDSREPRLPILSSIDVQKQNKINISDRFPANELRQWAYELYKSGRNTKIERPGCRLYRSSLGVFGE